MPSDRTTVTELGTGLGMLDLTDVDTAVRVRPATMHSVSPEMWERLAGLRDGGAYDLEFHAAWANGRAFLAALDGLRGRLPRIIEWKGTGRAPGDEVAPIDLRVDHVYLVSCKYLSNILFNVSPFNVFDALLSGASSRSTRVGRGSRGTREGLAVGGDWFADVAPVEYQALYETVRTAALSGSPGVMARSTRASALRPIARSTAVESRRPVALPGLGDAGMEAAPVVSGPGVPASPLRDLPERAADLTSAQRDALGMWLRTGWPAGARELYARLSESVARASARRWEAALADGGATSRGSGEAMLWRLLRIGSAPYFVLGSSASRSLRLRVATSWDWRQHYRLLSIAVEAQAGGQPRVGWEATVRDRVSNELHVVGGHIEVRWSHGRFGGLPEAKGYLDTPHHRVPGYFALR
jgi:hypothetical protein